MKKHSCRAGIPAILWNYKKLFFQLLFDPGRVVGQHGQESVFSGLQFRGFEHQYITDEAGFLIRNRFSVNIYTFNRLIFFQKSNLSSFGCPTKVFRCGIVDLEYRVNGITFPKLMVRLWIVDITSRRKEPADLVVFGFRIIPGGISLSK